MPLPEHFQFSQGSLQDYVDCPRRFQLKYMLRLAWPAVQSEPAMENERFMQQGSRFHRLVQQHLLGVPGDRLQRLIHDVELNGWWNSYLEHAWNEPPVEPPLPEVSLYAPLGSYRLVAKYDALAFIESEGGKRVMIVDWKTSRKRLRRSWLAERMQTRVYPYLLVQAGAHLNGGIPIRPEQVEMVYWFAAFPNEPERFHYSEGQYAMDQVYLLSLVAEIETLGEAQFPMGEPGSDCRYCTYRSLCDRGLQAGERPGEEGDVEGSEDLDFDIDFDNIPEMRF